MTRRLLLAIAAVGLAAGIALAAQQQAADPNAGPSFEAASIKPTQSSGPVEVRVIDSIERPTPD